MRENISENIHRERNYGLDLFRFISMLMIVGLHVIGNGGILDNAQPLTIRGEAVWLLEIACYCSVNCFALASGYVGVKRYKSWYHKQNCKRETKQFFCKTISHNFTLSSISISKNTALFSELNHISHSLFTNESLESES